MQLPKKMPEIWKESKFYVSDRKLKVICIASIVIAAISVLVLLVSTSIIQICGNICILVFSIIMALIFDKRVHLSPAYEVKK